jgi:hypothetical protein
MEKAVKGKAREKEGFQRGRPRAVRFPARVL